MEVLYKLCKRIFLYPLYNFVSVKRMTASRVRRDFAEVVNRAYYAKETTVITKHGKSLAAIVPVSSIASEAEVKVTKKRPRGATSD